MTELSDRLTKLLVQFEEELNEYPRAEGWKPADGAEAEALRQGIEEMMTELQGNVAFEGVVGRLQKLLDGVSARDSYCFLEERNVYVLSLTELAVVEALRALDPDGGEISTTAGDGSAPTLPSVFANRRR